MQHETVVVYVDGHEHDDDAALTAVAVARERGLSTVHVACVTGGRETFETMRIRAEVPVEIEHAIGRHGDGDAIVREVIERLPAHGLRVVGHVLKGSAPSQVRRLARHVHAAAVVLPGPRVPLELKVAASWDVVVARPPRRTGRFARAATAVRRAAPDQAALGAGTATPAPSALRPGTKSAATAPIASTTAPTGSAAVTPSMNVLGRGVAAVGAEHGREHRDAEDAADLADRVRRARRLAGFLGPHRLRGSRWPTARTRAPCRCRRGRTGSQARRTAWRFRSRPRSR